MEVRMCLASAVVVQRVPAEAVDWFMEWQRGVSSAAAGFAGCRGTDIYPPAAGQGDAWVVAIHFTDQSLLDQWLSSPVRAQWVAKLKEKVGDFELKLLRGGFGPWFANRADASAPLPPSWKMALTVLLALYPIVMLLSHFVAPHTSRLGFAPSMLIQNMISVPLLQWAVVPVLNLLLAPWLLARKDQWARTVGGTVLILAMLAGLVELFK